MLEQKKCCPQRRFLCCYSASSRPCCDSGRRAIGSPTSNQKRCPNPASTISLLVKGSSMSPLILDGYIIAVDTSDTAHDDLIGKIVVAWNREQGLIVSRLIRFDHTDVLVSDHRNTCRSHWRLSRSGASSAECCGGQGSQADNRRQLSVFHPRNVD